MKVPCVVGERSYHARLPDGWDGTSPLPVLIHFHGWARQGPLVMRHRRIAGATRKRGVLLLAPNGRNRSWSFWSKDSADVPFASDVLADAAKRWPIDRSRIYVSGYSYGSAMAWRFACEAGEGIAALLAIAGTVPDQSEDCQAPIAVRHVHGTRDTVMDFPFGEGGDVTGPIHLWRRINGCREAPSKVFPYRAAARRPLTRQVWTGCESGKDIRLDIHARGHFIPRRWLDVQLAQLLGQPVELGRKEPDIGRHKDGMWP